MGHPLRGGERERERERAQSLHVIVVFMIYCIK